MGQALLKTRRCSVDITEKGYRATTFGLYLYTILSVVDKKRFNLLKDGNQ